MQNVHDEKWIEHEIRIRVQKETTESNFAATHKIFDEKINNLEKSFNSRFTHLDWKLNFLIGICVLAFVTPIIKSAMGF